MGMFTHLGGIRLGTIKEGASANCGAVVAIQTAPIVFGADGTVTTICNLPAGAQITSIEFSTTTAYNSGTTSTIKFGTTSGGVELATATNNGSVGRYTVTTTAVCANWMIGASDVTVYATYNQTGTPATAGAGRVTVIYAVKNSDATIANPA